MSDVPPSHPDFAAVQWWGTAGGLHGLAPALPKAGQRGKNIVGQYFEAFPGHAAELDSPLDAATTAGWKKLAAELGITPPTGDANDPWRVAAQGVVGASEGPLQFRLS